MNKKILLVILAVVLFAGVATAAVMFLFPYEPKQPPKVDDVGSTQQGIQQVVNANNQFAFDLYSELNKSQNGNIFYSPYSISAALAMTYEGAKGQTADEMKSVFHFPENNILRPNFAAIYNEINKGNNAYELRTGNALWAQYDYKFLEDYTSRVEKYYGGKVANLDFKTETEKSRQTINSFIEEQTNDRIKDLIPSGILDPMTRLVLTNAIYFKGTWEWEFDESDTREQDFKITSTNTVKIPMMYMKPDKTTFNYADLEKLQILELPYKGEKISMLILLPKQGEDYDYETRERIVSDYTLKDIEISSEKLNEYKSQMKETKLDSISLPKFEFDTKYFMKDTLSAMGMPTAFGAADFSGLDGTTSLQISQVIHQAFVKVDEKGTEAAAATSVIMEKTAMMPRNVFRADHPFIFAIQEKDTGNILFLGRMIDPTK
ncbi:MAG: serpin family protein [Patescibacteria group bacterium]|jgi:serine protease inhibitor|nr:serpin family protein [Patescibacteria group bacterium]